MNPHKISAHSDNKQKRYGMLLIELVTWGVTNRDVLLLATIRYATFKLDDYVLSTVVTKSKLEALVFIAP